MSTTTTPAVPPALPGEAFDLDSAAGRLRVYRSVPSQAVTTLPLLLVHSVNAAGSAREVRPLYEHYRQHRPVIAFDLPGFGLSELGDRPYSPRLMTDAVLAVVQELRRLHGPVPIDTLAVSLGCEFLARAAVESPASFRSVALVSPTGFSGTTRRLGPPGSTRKLPGLHAVLSVPLWGAGLFRALTRPGVIRFFLEKTWGSKAIDEDLWRYDTLITRQPGAHHAPLHFLGGGLFSGDVNALYDALAMPVWMSHGTRGDFVDYRGKSAYTARPNWRFDVFEAGALPYFELPADFMRRYDAFLASS
ncbi:MAG TPA: alpha/beta hydrolase [Piscinibacter sp.]|nr:alpha/beta hydrolase [Piscinibacter sp.]